MIDPDEYLVLGRYETKLALNNNGDSVRLLNEDGQVILESSYTDAPEGAARVLGDKDGWMWTKTPTPGQKNIIKAVEEKKITKSVVNVVKQVRLNELFGLAKGTKVQTSGVVVVEPDIFSSQYIYITDKDNSAGVQVYMYTKDWPDLVAGDEISVIGEISEAYGQKRVKIKAREDIKRMGPVQSMSISTTSISNIDESDVGRLMKINGEVTEIKSLYMYVDDGDEIKVGFKKGTGVGKKDFMIGDLVAITGVLVSSKEEFQLLPRSMEDIVKTNLPDIPEVGLNKKKGKKRKYLGVVAIGTVLVLMGLFVKSKEVCEKDGGRKVENVVSLVLDKIKSLWG